MQYSLQLLTNHIENVIVNCVYGLTNTINFMSYNYKYGTIES